MKVNQFLPNRQVATNGASCSRTLFEKFFTFLEWATKRATNSDKMFHFANDLIFVGLEDKASPYHVKNQWKLSIKFARLWGAFGHGKICGADLKIGLCRFRNRLRQTSGINA